MGIEYSTIPTGGGVQDVNQKVFKSMLSNKEGEPLNTETHRPWGVVKWFYALPALKVFRKHVVDNQDAALAIDAHYLPGCNSKLIMCIGAYRHRDQWPPVSVNHQLKGLVVSWSLNNAPNSRSSAQSACEYAPQLRSCIHHICPRREYIFLVTTDGVLKVSRTSSRITKIADHEYIVAIDASFDERLLACVMAIGRTLQIQVFARVGNGHNFPFSGFINCDNVVPRMQANRYHNNRVILKWSKESQFLAVANESGHAFVLNSALQVVCTVSPGVLTRGDVHRCVRNFDFRPTTSSDATSLATFSTIGAPVVDVIDVTAARLRQRYDMSVAMEGNDANSADTKAILVYSSDGLLIALAVGPIIYLLSAREDLSLTRILNPSDELLCAEKSPPSINPTTGWFTSLQFDGSSKHIMSAANDGYVRIWEMEYNISLRDVCKSVILRHCVHRSRVKELPLPKCIISYLLD